jgi:glyoxylase-like metal-dependent hydrolase (beta-lactamase superfamily II)
MGAATMALPKLKVGTITIVSLSDGRTAALPGDIWPSVPAGEWEQFGEYLGPDETLDINFGCFLIHEDDTWTLVDTGFGTRPESRGGALVSELERADVHPDQIARVIITHMHGDHIGGNTVDVDGKPVPVFTNARHVLQRQDWVHFQQPTIKSMQPPISLCGDPIEAAGLLDLIDGSQSLSPAISILPTPGHTPGHQSVLVSSGGEKVIILGDVSHTPVQVIRPDLSPMYDTDPRQSARTRAELFERIEQEGLRVAAGHYPYPSFGGIVRVEGKRRWQPMS